MTVKDSSNAMKELLDGVCSVEIPLASVSSIHALYIELSPDETLEYECSNFILWQSYSSILARACRAAAQ